jgi:hypothetical protein
MKHLLKTAITPLALFFAAGWGTNAGAAPLLTITDNLNLYLTGTVEGQFNSNVLSSAFTAPGTSKSDYVLTVTPGLELDYGRNTATTVSVKFQENLLWYLHNTALNNQLANVYVTGSHVQGSLTVDANFSFVQNYTNTPSTIVPGVPVATILESYVYNAGTKLAYEISPKFDTDLGFQFTQTDYQGQVGKAYQNDTNYYVPANFYYSYSPKLDLGLAYYLNYSDPSNSVKPATQGIMRYDNFVGASARVKQWEKLTGSVNLGVDLNHVSASDGAGVSVAPTNQTSFAYGLKLQYDYSPKLSAFLNGQRNFQTGAQGQNIQVTSMALSGHYAYSSFVSFDATALGWSYSQYIGSSRADTSYNSGFSVNWTPTSYLTLSTGYSYFLNTSNTAGATYNINLISVSAAIRY